MFDTVADVLGIASFVLWIVLGLVAVRIYDRVARRVPTGLDLSEEMERLAGMGLPPNFPTDWSQSPPAPAAPPQAAP